MEQAQVPVARILPQANKRAEEAGERQALKRQKRIDQQDRESRVIVQGGHSTSSGQSEPEADRHGYPGRDNASGRRASASDAVNLARLGQRRNRVKLKRAASNSMVPAASVLMGALINCLFARAVTMLK